LLFVKIIRENKNKNKIKIDSLKPIVIWGKPVSIFKNSSGLLLQYLLRVLYLRLYWFLHKNADLNILLTGNMNVLVRQVNIILFHEFADLSKTLETHASTEQCFN